MDYVGRFAPSPSGPLHFGSLVAALASWLDARHAGGQWLLRIEDLDQPRVVPGAEARILRQLESCGLEWDGTVLRQSERDDVYAAALERLAANTYPCACTRRELEDSALAIDGARIYPGTCRGGLAAGKTARALRLRTEATPIGFRDRGQGDITQSVRTDVGDFVLRRADGIHSYQLAVVVDDAAQGITDVVRGADLLDSTARQITLQRLLGVPTPRYLHVPVAVTPSGEKLSKQTHAPDAVAEDLPRALRFLGMDTPGANASPREFLAEALKAWDPARLPRRRFIPLH